MSATDMSPAVARSLSLQILNGEKGSSQTDPNPNARGTDRGT